MEPSPTDLLLALADLAPAGGSGDADRLDVTAGGRSFEWFGTDLPSQLLFHAPKVQLPETVHNALLAAHQRSEASFRPATETLGIPVPSRHRRAVQGLGAIDALHREERLLRAGWVFLAGPATIGGETRRLLLPLLAAPVRVTDSVLATNLVNAGDAELIGLAAGPDRDVLEDDPPWGGGALGTPDYLLTERTIGRFPKLQSWIQRVVAACGLPPVRVLAPTADLRACRDGDQLVAVVGLGLYLARDVDALDAATGLRNWAQHDGLDRTAFAAVLTPGRARVPAARVAPTGPVRSPLALTAVQQVAVRRSRLDAVTVVSGPPGTGKSHTVCAVALDAVARGERVLVATQTNHAAEVLVELLYRQPGPTPVTFGSSERRSALAAELAGGLGTAVDDDRLGASRRSARTTAERRAWIEQAVRDLLAREARAEAAAGTDDVAALLQAAAPGAFDPDVDLVEVQELAARAAASPTGAVGRWRARRADRRLRQRLGVATATPRTQLDEAITVAIARRTAAELAAAGGTHIGAAWNELARAEQEERLALGALLTDQVAAGPTRDRAARRAVLELATALRSGRAARRKHLASLDGSALLRALPLWVGTLRDIDDLLPASPALFDLVVLDEASQIDLPRATVALLRGVRAVVVGDPHQLRHVSFVADVDIDAVLAAHRLEGQRDRLDVRRISAFDAAAGVAPVLGLDEHFRSVPHLIEFSARHFYPTTIHVATRHPVNEHTDAIDVVHVPGRRDRSGVNAAEVAAVRDQVRALIGAGRRDIGVLSPFRAQADALEAMLLDELTMEEIDRLGVRVGTVHGFQGAERDVIVASLALSDSDPPGVRRFVEDPHLFNVMVTRARQHLIVVHSLVTPGRGLIGQYLHHADHPPAAASDGPADGWTAVLAEELRRSGLRCRAAYPVGRWTVDLCLGDDGDAVAIECRVHPAGPGPHLERHLQLQHLGWRILEGWSSRFDADPVRAAIVLATEARHRPDRH